MGRSILFLILLFVFPLSACSHKSSAPVSADTMPDMEELLAYSQSHSQEEYEKKLKEIQAVIDNTSYEEALPDLYRFPGFLGGYTDRL